MPNYEKTARYSTKNSVRKATATENQIDAFFELCKSLLPKKNLLRSCETLVEESAQLRETHKKIIEKISLQPFLVAFMVWTKEKAIANTDMMNAAKLILENGYIGTIAKNGKEWTIADARSFDHTIVLDAIRCQREMPLQAREYLVGVYLAFMKWLADETQGYVPALEDPDLAKIKGRLLSYSQFITFINALKDKEQLLAKLLYYGGNRTLDDVLSLQIEDVDFKKQLIRYDTQLIHYPAHVFTDIQAIRGKKTRGQLFVGRQSLPLHPTTIFRNFKVTAAEVGLGTAFSPAVLTSSI